MDKRSGGGWLSAASWLLFPIVPAVLAQSYHHVVNLGGADPRDWGGWDWVILLSPLVGYAFLAGATVDLPDDPARRGLRGVFARRSVWVGVGPWLTFLCWVGVYYAIRASDGWIDWNRVGEEVERRLGTTFVQEAFEYFVFATLCGGWLVVAFAAVRRARRLGVAWKSVRRGLATAVGFVGSLIGSFWAATEVWRGYFFDTTIIKVALVAALSVGVLSGCGNVTAGEVRRRELFSSMLVAWVIGLALIWRWWSRSRSRPPRDPGPDV